MGAPIEPQVVSVAGDTERTGGELEAAPAGGPWWSAGVERDVRGFVLRRLLGLSDAAALVTAFVVAFTAETLIGGDLPLTLGSFMVIVLGAPAWIVLAQLFGLYHVDTRRVDHWASEEVVPIAVTTMLWCWGAVLVGAAADLQQPSIRVLALFSVAAVAAVSLSRSLVRGWSRRQDWYQQNALIVGEPREAAPLLRRLRRHPEYGVNVVACVTQGEGDTSEFDVPSFSDDRDIVQLIDALAVDRVFLVSSNQPPGERSTLVAELGDAGVHIDLVPREFEMLGAHAELHQLEGVPLVTLPHTALPTSALFLKRLLDLTLTIPALIALSPLLAFIAVRIRLGSPGPALFKQERVGRDGQRFIMLKFRSMASNADQIKSELAEQNMHARAEGATMFKIPEDPRTTKFGRWLRRYSLDELPQLWNVVKGEMSLVGPRPLIMTEADQVTGRYRRRLQLTPGLTGLWQVLGRSDIPFEDMVRLDYLYVTSWSLAGDFKLLLRTIATVVRGRGAY